MGPPQSDRDYARSVTFGPTQPLDDDVDHANIANVPEAEEQIIAILEDLPAAFTKDYNYGLGLAKLYRFIVEAVEEQSDCTEIVISREGGTRVDETAGIFHIETSDFDTIRKMLNSTTRMGQIARRSVKKAEAYNFFAEILGRPPMALKMGRHRLRKLLTRAVLNDDTNLSEEDGNGVRSRRSQGHAHPRLPPLVRLPCALSRGKPADDRAPPRAFGAAGDGALCASRQRLSQGRGGAYLGEHCGRYPHGKSGAESQAHGSIRAWSERGGSGERLSCVPCATWCSIATSGMKGPGNICRRT